MRYDAIALPCVRLLPDGTPDGELIARCRLAAGCYRQGLAPVVLASGGPSASPISEAAAAAALLAQMGVPPGALLLDEQSTDTPGNARQAALLLGAGRRVLVVTSDYHLRRALALYRRAGLAADGRAVKTPGSAASRRRRRMEYLYRLDLALGWHDGRRKRPGWAERAFYAIFRSK
ncbi:MAG: YdcF family protein [Clostridiales bacterium]|nr:YdcF family protein [Clostridiales bacterium]